MKILFVADKFGGGGKERRLLELIKGLDAATDYSLYLLILNNDLYYKQILNTKCEVKLLGRTNGIEVRIYKEIKQVLNEFRPDIIHFWGEVGMTYLLPTTIFGKTPTISSIIASTSPHGGLIKPLLRKISFRFTDLIMSNTLLGLSSYGVSGDKTRVVYNGFDFNRIANLKDSEIIRNKYNIQSEFVIMMVGHYSIRKDYKTFLKATEEVIRKGVDITVITAGTGSAEYIREFVDVSYEDRYRLLEFQDDVESIMNVADVGVLCSNSQVHKEGISNALLEFMALTKPVIATNDGGNVELIEDEASGYLVAAQDYVSLSEKLMLLLNDHSLRTSMGEKSRKIVEEKFSIKNMIDQFIKQYTAVYEHKHLTGS